jgi:hypothetical protein
MAQLHVIGELVGGKDFPSANLFCKFGIVAGPDWRLLEGLDSGQTQVTLALTKSRTDNNPPSILPCWPQQRTTLASVLTRHSSISSDMCTTCHHPHGGCGCPCMLDAMHSARAPRSAVDVNLLNTNTHFQSHPQVDHPVLTEMAQWSHPIGTSAHTQTQTHTLLMPRQCYSLLPT